ncbi:MAG: hypothetical protein ACI4LM_04280 [Anaerovoracaceae bacterium]
MKKDKKGIDSMSKEEVRTKLIEAIAELGHPPELGAMIADSLGGSRSMYRMLRYVKQAGPKDPDDLADEMLAIREDRDSWVRKKSSEYYNSKLNIFMNEGLTDDRDDDQDDKDQ